MPIRPLHDGIIVKTDPQKRMEGRIHLPDSKQPRVMTGVVQRVGNGRLFVDGVYVPAELKVGERVVFFTAVKEGGTFKDIVRQFLEDGNIIMDHRDVLFVIEGDEIPDLA